jgi:hypothetical protein
MPQGREFDERSHGPGQTVLPQPHQDLLGVLVSGVHRTGGEFGRTGQIEGTKSIGAFLAQEIDARVEQELVVASGIGSAAPGGHGAMLTIDNPYR